MAHSPRAISARSSWARNGRSPATTRIRETAAATAACESAELRLEVFSSCTTIPPSFRTIARMSSARLTTTTFAAPAQEAATPNTWRNMRSANSARCVRFNTEASRCLASVNGLTGMTTRRSIDSTEEIEGFVANEFARAAVAAAIGNAARQHDGPPFIRLSHDERRGRSHFIGHAEVGRAQGTSVKVGRTAQIEQSGKTADADRRTDRAVSPGAADAVVDDDADIAMRARTKRFAQTSGAVIGIPGEQQHARIAPVGVNVGRIDTGVGQHEATNILDHDHACTHAQHLARLTEDDLDEPGVLVRDACELHGTRRRRDAAKTDHASFGFRDDLLCKDEHVAVFKRQAHVTEDRKSVV